MASVKYRITINNTPEYVYVMRYKKCLISSDLYYVYVSGIVCRE